MSSSLLGVGIDPQHVTYESPFGTRCVCIHPSPSYDVPLRTASKFRPTEGQVPGGCRSDMVTAELEADAADVRGLPGVSDHCMQRLIPSLLLRGGRSSQTRRLRAGPYKDQCNLCNCIAATCEDAMNSYHSGRGEDGGTGHAVHKCVHARAVRLYCLLSRYKASR